MAKFYSLAQIIPQYDKVELANHWLKAYNASTTTPRSLYADADGAGEAAKFQLDSEGFPITAGNARITPHIGFGLFDLWLFPTASEADGNDTTNAIQISDNVNPKSLSPDVEIALDQCFSDQDFGLVGQAAQGIISVLDIVRVNGGLSKSDNGGALWQCLSYATMPVSPDYTQIVGSITISWLDAKFWVPDGTGNGYQFDNIEKTKNADQYGVLAGTTTPVSLIPTICNTTDGAPFVLSNILPLDDYNTILSKTNTTDYSDTINAVLSACSDVYVPKGRWYAGDLVMSTQSKLEGAGWGAYSTGVDGNTAFYVPSGKTGFMNFNGRNALTISNFTVNCQNNGDGFYSDGGGNHFYLDLIKVYNADVCVRGNGGNPLSDLHTTNCIFRESSQGVAYVQDSTFSTNTTFSALTFRGMLLEGGQIRIVDCFFEFLNNNQNAVNAIETFGNLDELILTNCQFDRVAGHAIKFGSGASNVSRHVTIDNNLFKRGAWGENLAQNQRYDIYQTAGTITDINIGSGNVWQRGDQGISPIQGAVSPNGAWYLPSVNRLTIGTPSIQDLQSYNYNETDPSAAATDLFVQSTDTPTEYYFNFDYYSPPDFVRFDGTNLSAGTAGSLAAGERAMGSIDGQSRPYLYVRLPADANPNDATEFTVARSLDQTFFGGSDIQTPEYRDRAIISTISPNTSLQRVLRTRTNLQDTNNREFAGAIEIHGWEQGDSRLDSGSARFNFLLTRGSGLLEISEGQVEALNSSGFSMNWSSSGTGKIRLTINPDSTERDPFGSQIDLLIEAPATNTQDIRDLKILLRW